MTMRQVFYDKGWCRFNYDPALMRWVSEAFPYARAAIVDPDNAHWLRCGGTWHAGVNALSNDAHGRVSDVSVLDGDAISFIHALGFPAFRWDRAQVSVCYPGYPQPMETESEAAYGFRLHRDSAHVDGLRKEGPEGRRYLREYHGFVLGIPLVEVSADASPFVIWEGSHEVIRQGFKTIFDNVPPENWGYIDVTESYTRIRREVFSNCERVVIAAKPGESYVVHRLALHGVAPWADQATAGPDGRMIAYFRPDFGSPLNWLNAP